MALVNRLTRLFQADFHAVLDRIEEPDLQLRQAVREMQFALEQDRQRSQLLRHEAGELARQARITRAALKAFDEELDLCLAADKEDLARDLVRRKLMAERQLEAIEQQAGQVESQMQSLGQRIEEQQQQLDSMKQKLDLLVTRDEIAGESIMPCGDTVRGEEIEIALLREKQRRSKRRGAKA